MAQVLTTKKVAARLGCSPETFRARRPKLEQAGFPKPDPILRGYIDEDVEAFLARRRQIDDDAVATSAQEVNFDAL